MRGWTIVVLVAALALVAASPSRAAAMPVKKAESNVIPQETLATMDLFKKTDPTMVKLFNEAAGYVVFPSVTKGGIGIGAAHGNGDVFDAGRRVGMATLTQTTIGLQLGGQEYAEMIFFETREALDQFKTSQLTFSAQVSAVAGAEGAANTAKYQQGVLVFTIAKGGLMFEASIGGQKFKFIPLMK